VESRQPARDVVSARVPRWYPRPAAFVVHPGQFGAKVTAIDIAPLMLERAAANVRAARLCERGLCAQLS
jgi:hypothetical protein